jgi:hypothetical protein
VEVKANDRKESPMAQYAVLIYAPTPGDPADIPPEEMAEFEGHDQAIKEAGGTIRAAYALQPSTTATSVRGGLVTDGPFIEAKEVLAGFFILEARDLDHALAIAKLDPANRRGGVEVRPLLDAME